MYFCDRSFGPMWQLIKVLEEKLSSVHFQLTNGWNDLTKDVQRYVEEQQKKQRAVICLSSGRIFFHLFLF